MKPKLIYIVQGSGGVVSAFASKKKLVAFLKEKDWPSMPWSVWHTTEGEHLTDIKQVHIYKHGDLL